VFRWRVVRQQVGVTSLAALQADDPRRVGPYLLLGRLGSGGMGRVYLARSPGGRQVAVKVIRPQLAEDTGFRARFAREVSAARKVGGLFTAQVVDADLDSPLPWLVTAYVPGTSLSEAVEQLGPLPVGTLLALAAGLAEGLSAIHAAGVIHRDLKPSNVLLAPDGPRIIDFGISSAVDATSLTGTGLMIGSPGFMSPEQAEGMPVRPSSDIFSLAGVLIFAARGEGPFGTGDTAALLYRVVHGTPNLDRIPDNMRPLISRCLSRSAAARPTAPEFLAELTAAYPSAADLTEWLPAGILKLAAQHVAEADPHPPTMGSAAAAAADVVAPVASAAGTASAGAAGAAGAGLVRAAAAETAEPAARANAAADAERAAEADARVEAERAAEADARVEAERAAEADAGVEADLAGHAVAGADPGALKPAAAAGAAAEAGLATSGNGPDSWAPTAKSPIPPPNESMSQGPQGVQRYPALRGYLGQPGSGGQEGQQGPGDQGGPGASWPQDTPGWAAQPGAGAKPAAGAQQPGGGGQPGSGAHAPPPMPYPDQLGPQANQWYSPLIQPKPQRRRKRWPWAVGAVAAVCAVVIVAVLLSLGSSHPGTSAGVATSPLPSPTAPRATSTPTVGKLQLYQLRVGDCLTGANMELNTSNPWPKLTLAVPCNEPHTAEVFLADNNFWPQNSPFPGSSKISKAGNTACNNAFRSYVGIAYSKSIYTWTNIIPDASTWPTGDRALHCVAYYSTQQQRAGVTLTHSIKGARK
jgi:Protein kinase domain/Septum formation